MDYAKEKRGYVWSRLFCSKGIFLRFMVYLFMYSIISMYSILNTLLEYTYFYISKNITSYTFVACFQKLRKPSVYPSVILILHGPFLPIGGILPLSSQISSVSTVFFFTMHNCFILIFFSLWYWFSTVIVQSRSIVQSCFGSFLAFPG